MTEKPFVTAVSQNHPLTTKRTITFNRLIEQELISLPFCTGQRASLEQACAARGLKLRVSFEAGDPRVLAELAATGLGVAIVPRSVATTKPDATLHTLEITQPHLLASSRSPGERTHPPTPPPAHSSTTPKPL